MKSIPKNIPIGLFKKAFKHLEKAEQSLSYALFSTEDWNNIEQINRKYKSIKQNN